MRSKKCRKPNEKAFSKRNDRTRIGCTFTGTSHWTTSTSGAREISDGHRPKHDDVTTIYRKHAIRLIAIYDNANAKFTSFMLHPPTKFPVFNQALIGFPMRFSGGYRNIGGYALHLKLYQVPQRDCRSICRSSFIRHLRGNRKRRAIALLFAFMI
jgi:hypothetical protein